MRWVNPSHFVTALLLYRFTGIAYRIMIFSSNFKQTAKHIKRKNSLPYGYPLATYPTPRTVRIYRPRSKPNLPRRYRIYTSTTFVSPT